MLAPFLYSSTLPAQCDEQHPCPLPDLDSCQPYGDALFAAVKGALKPKCLTFSPLYIPAHSRASAHIRMHNLPADRGAVVAAAALCK